MAGKEWEDSEVNYLKENFQEKTCEEMAEYLNRSTRSVQHKFGQLGLKRKKAQIGDVVNGWLITDIFLKEAGNQHVSFAKLKSTLIDGTEKEERLTKLTLAQIGWPDRRRPDMILKNTTHNSSKTRLYRIWYGMKNRCYNQKQTSYKDYGGRGITICEDWDNFISFKKWAEANGYMEELTLDRINVDGNYEPINCKWSTWKEQCENKRSAIDCDLTAFGETKSIYRWANDERCMVDISALHYRSHAGWDHEEAITKPSERNKCKPLKDWLLENHPEILDEYYLDK